MVVVYVVGYALAELRRCYDKGILKHSKMRILLLIYHNIFSSTKISERCYKKRYREPGLNRDYNDTILIYGV